MSLNNLRSSDLESAFSFSCLLVEFTISKTLLSAGFSFQGLEFPLDSCAKLENG